MTFKQMKSIIEGLLFVAGDEGLEAKQLAEVLETDTMLVREAVTELKRELEEQDRGVRIAEIAGAFRMTSNPDHAPYLQRLAYSPTRSNLSQAAIETLSIIAYRQPITRVEIETIRGVSSDRAIQTLVAKQLVEEVGRADAVGRPILYGTTKMFLDYFGLKSLEDLPAVESLTVSETDLEEETRLLFQKLQDAKQLTIDDLPPI
ncbi:SMC-Scp complex subunit ScpB [Paenibacillus thermoaerophilus]|uniref:Segregation and condensation protein B n=1 Tax=Paenibacillus thermoaerophilus TaxID=1215385 RepID=A0ABW2V5W8_9BACL|nr:SMC-Scp complex subunit ScpB [Paenibacillus thermoaerophilus]TMV07517.1 SMC-Scp complex subunit ScpB [Paenibacillus thermoaerophilus]